MRFRVASFSSSTISRSVRFFSGGGASPSHRSTTSSSASRRLRDDAFSAWRVCSREAIVARSRCRGRPFQASTGAHERVPVDGAGRDERHDAADLCDWPLAPFAAASRGERPILPLGDRAGFIVEREVPNAAAAAPRPPASAIAA